MSEEDHQNVISPDRAQRHSIRRYEFKTLETPDDTWSSMVEGHPLLTPTHEPVTLDESHAQEAPQANQQVVAASTIEKELIERLLTKSDELSSTLMKMHAQIERQQNEIESRVAEAREDAFTKGIAEGVERHTQETEQEQVALRESIANSLQTLDGAAQKFQAQVSSFEKELSAIAVDIAKEVIVAEVSQNSSRIALSLAQSLIENVQEASKVVIKLNPEDYEFVASSFEGEKKIKIESDKAIAPGGVVIASDSGNIDGNVMCRFQTLKRSILDHQGQE